MDIKTGITIEKLENGYLIGIMGTNKYLLSREVDLADTLVARTDQELIQIIQDKLKILKPRGQVTSENTW